MFRGSSLGYPKSKSDGCTIDNVEHFTIFKMASKMAENLHNAFRFYNSCILMIYSASVWLQQVCNKAVQFDILFGCQPNLFTVIHKFNSYEVLKYPLVANTEACEYTEYVCFVIVIMFRLYIENWHYRNYFCGDVVMSCLSLPSYA